MLEVTFNEHRPGHRFELPAGETDFELAVQGLASSRRPLDRIEIVVNGRVAQRLEPENRRAADGGFASPVQAVVGVDGTSWLAVRCFERHPTGRVRFAHSNPVHVDVPDRPLRPRPPEVAYLMGRMEEEIARNQDVLDEASLEEYRQALADFRQKLGD
jgi:hypothetical protein